MNEQLLTTVSSSAGKYSVIIVFFPAGSSLSGGAVAGIVVGVMVFVALAVTGVVLAIILTWCFKC